MINIVGVVSVVIFYILILAVGMWAARKNSGIEGDQEEEVMLAGRNIGVFVGIFTMTATWVGGGYINGTAEIIYTQGLVWCQAPLGYALSLVLGGIFFAHRMRREGYVTMLDPLQECFGGRMGGLLFIPALCGEVFWSAGILAALGATLAVIINMQIDAAVILSALIAVMYTWIGGLYSVAYTDVVQLGCILIGLVICIPYAWTNEAVEPMTMESRDWIGSIPSGQEWYYADYMLLLTLGGIPWQVYFQRVLSSRSAAGAELISYIAAIGCILMAIPPILIGGIAKATHWNMTNYTTELTSDFNIRPEDARMVLPLVLQHLTPSYISFFGLGAVSAAVMSSADSSVLSASSMFARNVYKLIFRQGASDSEIMWVMRIAIFIVGAMATFMALTIPTIYGLWAMCSDLVYVVLFPQLLIVVHFKDWCNTYGSLFAYIVGMFVRLSGGENLVHLPPLIKFPMYDEESGVQLFPFRTLAMVLSMTSLLGISHIAWVLFTKKYLSTRWDVFHCFDRLNEETANLGSADVKTYRATDERNGPLLDAAENRPIRKPDPDLRTLRRQISFGSTTGFGSLRKKPTTAEHEAGLLSPPPVVAEESESVAAADAITPEDLPTDRVRLAAKPSNDMPMTEVTGAAAAASGKPMLKKGDRKESLTKLKRELKDGVKEIKEGVKDIKDEIKERAKHLPDGHRGSIASLTERPPYKQIEKQTEF